MSDRDPKSIQSKPISEPTKSPKGTASRRAKRQPKRNEVPKPVGKNQITRMIMAHWKAVLGDVDLTDDTTFFDAGGTSLELTKVHVPLFEELGIPFDITILFEAPRMGQLAGKLATLATVSPKMIDEAVAEDAHAPKPQTDMPDDAIAIVGMAARVPGVANLDEFWTSLTQGENLIRPFDQNEAEDSYTDRERASAAYIKARPDLAEAGMFDAKFFEMLPREAAVTDPQARVFLEMAHEVLERSGHAKRDAKLNVGVFAGCSMNSYMLHNVLGNRAETEAFTSQYQTGKFAEAAGNMSDCLAMRASFKLDLRGPAMAVQTTCSTSLTAIAQAVLALRAGQCEMALAGGISITFPQKRGYLTYEGGLASDDGTCRPFDDEASGTVFSHGGGVVALRRLSDAMADGDHIHAVIRGVGINNDGADKIAFTAPTVNGQADAIRRAHADAGIAPATISYVECHGTATPMGDPIEVSGLRAAFGPVEDEGACALGSVKGNIGHLDAGAGVMGVIKTAMMMTHRTLPPLANFKNLNTRIDLSGSPFRIQKDGANWTSPHRLRAGVSSFGVGGTNVHLVLEEAPDTVQSAPVSGTQAVILSAKSKEALDAMRTSLAAALEAPVAPDLVDAAFTLQEGRAVHPYRLAVAGDETADVALALRDASLPRKPALSGTPGVAFMFPGQGSQYPGMGSGLYAAEPEFARWIDQGAEVLQPILGLDVKTMLCFGETSDAALAAALRETRLTQPALYLTQYACAQLWMSRGITPAAMIGHSVGEFAAAALAGVFSFETGLKIISQRGQFMQDQPGGAMLSVRASVDDLTPHLDDTVEIAARNAPRLNVVAGETEAIAALEARLKAVDIPCSHLHTSHAFHSAMMDPVCDSLTTALQDISLSPAAIPYVSCVTGAWMTDEDCVDPKYWARQARMPVNFADAITTLAGGDDPLILLETGAGNTLSAFCGQTLPRDADVAVVQSLPDHTRPMDDMTAMATGFGRIWAAGGDVSWGKLGPRGTRRVPLPTYAYQRSLHWVDPAPAAPALTQPAAQFDDIQQKAIPMPASVSAPVAAIDRKPRLLQEVLALLSDLSGEDLGTDDAEATFLELGFDSLFLGQVAQKLAADFGLEVTFRQLLSQYPTAAAVADILDETLPADAAAPPVPVAPSALVSAPQPAMRAAPSGPADSSLMQAQIDAMQTLFARQLEAMSGGVPIAAVPAPAVPSPSPVVAAVVPDRDAKETHKPAAKAAFSIGRATNAGGGDLTPEQAAFADDLAKRYSARSPKSKEYVQKYRPTLADPRTVAGFRAEWKELVYPVVCDRSKGSRLWDIDGNEYVDLVNGFGQTAFGHSPDFVIEAMTKQMERGFAIGPQSDLAGPVAERFAAFVGHERAAFCNTGSEAVMAAMRIARTVTGRDKIVIFDDDYHGQFDEVLVKGKRRGGDPAALPIAPGIPRASLSQIVVLPYAAQSSLDWITANIADVAAVLVEPVQSRHPDLRPQDFVKSVRAITREGNAAMIMDEVVSGFRVGPRGLQGIWGIDADMATYGKVVGGGMPIGMLAGTDKYMGALDGGTWQFGDDSGPEASPTFFAGTFVRHPLVLAAIDATLDHMDQHGAALWEKTADLAARTVGRMNDVLEERGLPRAIETYSSWAVPQVTDLDPNAALLFPLMRMAGVHVQIGYPWYFTTSHTEADAEQIVSAFTQSVDAMRAVGILSGAGAAVVDVAAPAAASANALPLTPSQSEVWMTSQLGRAASCCFNESVSLDLAGPLDMPALQRAVDQVVARHDGLRMVFARNGETFHIMEPYSLSLDRHDVSGAADPAGALNALLREDAAQEIDIVAGPPIRGFVVRKADDAHVLVLSAHHIVCDGWSFNVLANDLAALYTQETTGTAAEMSPAPSFAAYAQTQRADAASEKTRAFWKSRFADVPELPELPTDHPRPQIKTFAGGTCTAHISGDVMRAARKAGASQGCTLFSTVFAALQITVGRLTGSQDVVLGVPTGGQALLPDGNLIGHCVNLLPIRVAQAPDMPAADFLHKVGEEVMDAFDHQDYTFGTLVQDLNITRSLNRMPLTEIQFNLEKLSDGLEMGPMQATMTPNPKAAVNFDLFFNIIERKDGLRVDVDYNADVFEPETVMRWIGHLDSVLDALGQDTARPLSDVSVHNAAQETWLAKTLNETQAPLDAQQTVPSLIAQISEKHGDDAAVADKMGQYSYRDLAARSDCVAAALQSAGIAQGSRVAVALPRSAQCVAALLGVMKAGCAYVPIDLAQPAARLEMILENADATAIVFEGPDVPSCADDLGLLELSIDSMATDATPKPVEMSGDATAYVMFTSGSTGTPKGVEISQMSVVNLLQSMAKETDFAAGSRLLSVTTIMFDISVLEMFMPLISGGSCVIAAHEDVLDGFALVARVGKGDITHMQATPTLWTMMLEAGLAPDASLRLLAGGEPLPQDLADRLTAQGATLWNVYGPTETTIWSAAARLAHGDRVTIGGPIANTDLHVLGQGDALLPIGAVGELNIGGSGLAKGYFGQPELTATAFRDVTVLGQTRRLYKTGDLARRLGDGRIEVLGRNDAQVKLRGFRIELGEIESALRGMPEVAAAAVALKPAPRGGDHLVGYVVAKNGVDPKPQDLAKALGAHVPGYMVPTAWAFLSRLPSSPSGKLDRRALPDPEVSATVTALQTAPATDTERKIAAIWSKVMGVDNISTSETLFALGADSLTVFRIAARLIDADVDIEARHLLEYSSIALLSEFVDKRATDGIDRGPKKPSLKSYRRGVKREA